MNLTLSEEQKLIKDSARKYLELNYSFDKRQKLIVENPLHYFKHWKGFADLGWLGLPFPEDVGGFGGNVNNLMTLMECLGANLILEPYIYNNLIIGKIFQSFPSNETLKFLEEGESSVIGIKKASKGSNSYRTFKKGTNFLNLPDKNLLHLQSSDLEEYVVTGSIFASKYINLVRYKSFHQPESRGIIIDDEEAIDINTELDFFIASKYASNFYEKN